MPDDVDIKPERTRNRWGEGERLRVEILDAAGRLLSGLGGEDGLTIRGVARAVGIAPASIYHHFTDRTALVQGLMDHEHARLRALMRAADEAVPPEDVAGRVHAQLYAYCDFATDNPGHHRLVLGNGSGEPRSAAPPVLIDVVEALTAAFARCEEAGHTLRLPSDRAAVMVFVAVYGRVALLHSIQRGLTTEERRSFIDELVSLVLA
ncbi:TetR/AcrR family transcriptional regulator [Streptomyces sp. NPDC087420]|uniref:TetR/AcrR family transcriptional regulator n=1 Tax=Streptomyces sp. NPDC087420 TaxID=3365785 RepID=UPI0038324E57